MVNNLGSDPKILEVKIKQLEQNNKILQQLIQTLHFDYFAQITTIVGYSKLLLTQEYGALNENQSEFIERIQSSSQRLLAYTDEIKNISYALSSTENPPEKLNLQQFLNEGNWQIDQIEIDNLLEIWVRRHWLYPTIQVLFSLPHGKDIIKRTVSCKSSNVTQHFVLHIKHTLSQKHLLSDNDFRLQSIQISAEQQGGFLNWKQLSENEVEFQLGLPNFNKGHFINSV